MANGNPPASHEIFHTAANAATEAMSAMTSSALSSILKCYQKVTETDLKQAVQQPQCLVSR